MKVKELRSKDTWTIFRIMAEFVEGFETLGADLARRSRSSAARAPRATARSTNGRRDRQLLGREGFAVITGGGPGAMEAANRGAREVEAPSIGLNIKLPFEQHDNGYADTVLHFDYFFARKVMFVKYACAFVMLPGGFGTLDEMFECLTLKQTGKSPRHPGHPGRQRLLVRARPVARDARARDRPDREEGPEAVLAGRHRPRRSAGS